MLDAIARVMGGNRLNREVDRGFPPVDLETLGSGFDGAAGSSANRTVRVTEAFLFKEPSWRDESDKDAKELIQDRTS